MKQKTLSVTLRAEHGRGPVRRLRNAKNIPAIVYGGETAPRSITLKEADFRMLMRSLSGSAAIIQLEGLGNDIVLSIIKAIVRNPRTDRVDHVDFLEVSAKKPMHTTVPVQLKGEAHGVKNGNGIIDCVSHQISISCLPKDLPEHIEVDITSLHLNQSIHINDLPAIPGITFEGNKDQVIVACVEQQAAEEVAPATAPAASPVAPAKASK
jgi:large subunit ribosomal protein L25